MSVMQLNGRRMIKTDESEVTNANVVTILRKALPFHWKTVRKSIICGITIRADSLS